MIYAVIDTNVIVSALITKYDNAVTLKILRLVAKGKITPLYNYEIVREYREVLGRAKFHLTHSEIERVVGCFSHNGLELERTAYSEVMPDEDDRVFYEVCLSKEDSFLVTGNLKHFPTPQIISPADLVRLIESKARG